MRSKSYFLGCFLCVLSFGAFATVRLPALFSDNMVLQRETEAPFWGWASPGEVVRVKGSWNNNEISATADQAGKWRLKLKTPAAGGPYTVTVKGEETLVLHNVLIGEVWVCSGQSNMEMPLKGWPGGPVLNSAAAINSADYPSIRLFTVQRHVALRPQEDCTGSWEPCSPGTAGAFSATAYFFGLELYRKLKIPVGLIHTSWGGTVAEAWTSEEALRPLGDFNEKLNEQDSLLPHLAQLEEEDARNAALWKEEVEQVDGHYAAAGLEDAGWKTMQLPAYWETAGLPGFDGIVWFRKTVSLPASWAGKELQLDLGPIDDMDITWFNGHKIGGITENGYSAENRSYRVPGNLVRPGKNVIAVRVLDLRGNGGIYGDVGLMQLYPVNYKNERISMAGGWRYGATRRKPQTQVSENPNAPSVLYNGMIAPVVPFAIRGAIWYQGESNVGRAEQYSRLFPTMITDWRARWEAGDFPFYFVQIAPFPYGGDGTKSAALRDAQRRTLALAQTGMAVTLDIGDTTNIHPANKEEVGRRLALWALAKTYGQRKIVYSGPLYKRMQVEGNQVRLFFDFADKGLMTKGGKLTSFEVAGSDGRFLAAQAVIKGKNVVVSSEQVSHPVAVRYAWRDNAVPHLFNRSGLPASAFTTEEIK